MNTSSEDFPAHLQIKHIDNTLSGGHTEALQIALLLVTK